MTFRDRPRREVWLGALLFVVLAAGAVFVLRASSRPAPNLDGIELLLAERRFDDVERRLIDYLRVRPDSLQANMLMAQVALNRDGQKPQLALDHLARIKTSDRGTRAIVLLNEGKAYSALGWNDRAEAAWKEVLRLEPRVPEAGWDLLGLYFVEGRRAAAHQLGMALHVVEPDPRDRAQLLLELVRQDAQPLGPESIVRTIEPLVRKNPNDVHMAIALGLAFVRNSQAGLGLSKLRMLVARNPGDPDTWDAWLLGLDEAGKFDELGSALAQLPAALAGDVRFERHRAAVAQERRDWSTAANAYLRAWRADPADFRVLYRLSRALKAAGRLQEAGTFDLKVRAGQQAKDQILPLYQEANAVKTLGVAPHPDLYHRLAALRERMGRDDEAIAWHRLVLQFQPDDDESNQAIARLQKSEAAVAKTY